MPPPKAPSSTKMIGIPVFDMSWFGDPGSSRSILAYCGGGGSAKTGVNNYIKVWTGGDDDDEMTISTGDNVAVAVCVYASLQQGHDKQELFVLASIGNSVQRFPLEGADEDAAIECNGQVDNVGDSTSTGALAVHCTGEVFAVGCEEGLIHVYQMHATDPWQQLFTCKGHTKAITCIAFAQRSDRLVSSAKDGTVRVWKQGGECIASMECDCVHPDNPLPKRKFAQQVLVRGCGMGDLEGNILYTVASRKLGFAFLYKWIYDPKNQTYVCASRLMIHKSPIAAFSLAADGGLLSLGGIDGTVHLIQITPEGDFKVLKTYKEIHDMQVTCLAARPWSMAPLGHDVPGIPMHTISASADSRMCLLTLERRVPRDPNAPATSIGWGVAVWLALLVYMCYIFLQECVLMCSNDVSLTCMYNHVLIAAPTRPGILSPPY